MAMKIERISDNQIKFILTEGDLSERNIRMNELSYGSEKTQELFREIMERATIECDFHTTHETPLIIEAIPVSRDGIMIIVTKVAGHEDLEDRFGYPPVLGNYKNVSRAKQKKKLPKVAEPDTNENSKQSPKAPSNQAIFRFDSFENVTNACARIGGFYTGSALFKYSGHFYLVVENDNAKPSGAQENILKEYSQGFSNLEISKLFLLEHGEIIIEKEAIDIISTYLM